MPGIGWLALFAVLTLLVVYLLYANVTGKWEYRRFLALLECESVHRTIASAREDESSYDRTFLRGVIFFDDETSFHFANQRAFDRAVRTFGVRVDHSRVQRA